MPTPRATRSPAVCRPHEFAAAALLAFAAASAGAAGSVAVSFAPTDRFADAGDFGRQRTDNLLELSLHLQRLGQRLLPDGQSLKIEVQDVDLAGVMKPVAGRGSDVRILNGRADWPRITLRWTLFADGRLLRSAGETVSDMNYLTHHPGRLDGEPLRYEKAMLDDWFKTRFAADAAHAAAAAPPSP